MTPSRGTTCSTPRRGKRRVASLGISDNEVLKRTRLWDQTRSHWHLWQGERLEEAGCVATSGGVSYATEPRRVLDASGSLSPGGSHAWRDRVHPGARGGKGPESQSATDTRRWSLSWGKRIWSTKNARKVPPHPVVPLMRSYSGGSLHSFARPKESTGNGDAEGRRSHKRLLSGGQPGRCYEVN